MTQFYPGPYEVEIYYVFSGMTHKQRLNCDLSVEAAPGDPFSSFAVSARNSSSVALNTAVDAWITLIRPLLDNTTNITTVNLWKYVPESFEKNFLSTYTVNLLGTGSVGQPSRQAMWTFITNFGNNMRISLMEGSATGNARIPITDAAVNVQAVANFLVGPTNWIIARDGGYPTGKLNYSVNVNDSLERRRYRSSI